MSVDTNKRDIVEYAFANECDSFEDAKEYGRPIEISPDGELIEGQKRVGASVKAHARKYHLTRG